MSYSILDENVFPIWSKYYKRKFYSLDEIKKYIKDNFCLSFILNYKDFIKDFNNSCKEFFKVKDITNSFDRNTDQIIFDEIFIKEIYEEILPNRIEFYENEVKKDIETLLLQISKLNKFNDQLQKFKIDNRLIIEDYPIMYNGPC